MSFTTKSGGELFPVQHTRFFEDYMDRDEQRAAVMMREWWIGKLNPALFRDDDSHRS